jgi:hypothetical protein
VPLATAIDIGDGVVGNVTDGGRCGATGSAIGSGRGFGGSMGFAGWLQPTTKRATTNRTAYCTTRAMKLVVALLVIVTACNKKPPPRNDEEVKKKDAHEQVSETKEAKPKKIDGPSVTPVRTDSVAFVVPKDALWWGEMNFACYRSVMSLTGTKTAGEAFEKLSPTVPSAMAAGDIDLGRDMAAMGAFDCGGTPCIYVAATLKSPEKMGVVLEKLLPGVAQKKIDDRHYTLDTPGMKGTRVIHVHVVPLQWTEIPKGDTWVTESARATHVVFIIGVDGKNLDIDPLSKLADAQTALAHVKDAEGVLADSRGRCILGRVGATDFQPGFKLERSRFALAAPSGKPDALMGMLGSERTLELVVELFLAPAAKDANVKKWVAQGRQYMSNLAGPVKMQFAGNPVLDVYLDMVALLGDRGFKYELKDKSLRFTWRTDRVPRSDLDALETRLQAVLGPQ